MIGNAIEYVTANMETIALGWAAIVGILEFLKRVIPGTKDDNVIVKIIGIGGRIMTFGASKLLPKQDGRLR